MLALTEGEIAFLQKLGQIPFLPVARKAGDMIPVYLEGADYPQEEYSLILQVLDKAYPVHGSIALTAGGQTVVEQLEKQGIIEE